MRPEVKVVANQQVQDSNPDITQSEAEALLAKYGYKQTFKSHSSTNVQKQNNLTFEEMVKLHELEEQRVRELNSRRQFGPRPVSFDSDNINYAETKYSDLELGNQSFGIKIEIVTDMKIN